MNKFTQGEWAVYDHGVGELVVHSEDNFCICAMDGTDKYLAWKDGYNTSGEAKANAHLISAAPDMYRALRDVAGELGYEADSGLGDGYYTVNLTQSEVDAIRAALAKADGGE